MRKIYSYSSLQNIRADSDNFSVLALLHPPNFPAINRPRQKLRFHNEFIFCILQEHLRSMPSSYAKAGLSVVEMLHHVKMLKEVQANRYVGRLGILIITRSDNGGGDGDSDGNRAAAPMWMEIHFADRCANAHSAALAALQLGLGKMQAKVKKIKMYRATSGGGAIFILRISLNCRSNPAFDSISFSVDGNFGRQLLQLDGGADHRKIFAADLDSRIQSVIEDYCLHAPDYAHSDIESANCKSRRCCRLCVDIPPLPLMNDIGYLHRTMQEAEDRNMLWNLYKLHGGGARKDGASSINPSERRLIHVVAEVVKRWWVDVPEEIVLGRRIGAGSSGVVFEGIYGGAKTATAERDVRQMRVAVKLIRGNYRSHFRREVLALAAVTASRLAGEEASKDGGTGAVPLPGRNRAVLVPFVGAAVSGGSSGDGEEEEEEGGGGGGFEYVIVTKFMEGGSLHQYLERSGGRLEMGKALDLAVDVAEGVAVLHARGIVHMDVKSPNVFLDTDGRAVLGDLGSARAVREKIREEMPRRCGGGDAAGTYRWMAPELLEGSLTSEMEAAPATEAMPAMDVYSLGMVLWEMVSGQVPFADMEPLPAAAAVLLRGLRPPIPGGCPAPLACLIRSCWSQQPEARPSAAYALRMLRLIRSNYLGVHHRQ